MAGAALAGSLLPADAAAAAAAAPAALPRGTLQFKRHWSSALGVERGFGIYLPPGYAAAPWIRYPVVYVLHGYGGSEYDWEDHGAIRATTDSLIAAGMRPVILVFPAGGRGFFTDWAAPVDYDACLHDTTALSLGPPADRCVRQARYASAVAIDLVTHIDSTYRTVPARASRGVAGVSMGGLGALTLALTYPERFGAAASFMGTVAPLLLRRPAAGRTSAESLAELEADRGAPQPGLRRRVGADSALWRHDPLLAARRLTGLGTPLPALWLMIGNKDQYVAENRALRAGLTALGVSHEYHEGVGRHNGPFYRRHAPLMVRWIAQRLAATG